MSHLFLRARFGPELQQAFYDLFREVGVLFQELDHTVGQLGVVEAETADFVQRDEDLAQELLVLQLQGKGEAVDNAPEDL